MVGNQSTFCFSSSLFLNEDDVKLVCHCNWYWLWAFQDTLDVSWESYWKNFNEGWRIGSNRELNKN